MISATPATNGLRRHCMNAKQKKGRVMSITILSRSGSRHLSIVLLSGLLSAYCSLLQGQESRWTEAKANAWYAQQPWPVGANFLPSDAINQLEMWQADTFDPTTIDRELGWA